MSAFKHLRRYDRAQEALLQAFYLKQRYEVTYEMQAELCNLAGRYDESYTLLCACSPPATREAYGWYQYVVACAGIGDEQEAYAASLHAVADDRTVGEQSAHVSWVLLGSAQWQVQHYAQALAAYEHAAQIKPDSFAAWRGIVTLLVRERRFQEVLAAYPQMMRALAAAPRRGWTSAHQPTLLDRIKRLW